ncbi:hypothetical protein D3C78_1200030 [compost metagenome]
MLHRVAGGLLLEVRLDRGLHVGKVIGMDALVAVFDAIADLGLRITENRFPARGVVDLPGLHIAVPDTGATAGDGQRHSSFAVTQGGGIRLQPGGGAIAFHAGGRQAGKIAEAFALRVIQGPRLVVEQGKDPDRASVRGEQCAGGIEANARIVDEQRVVLKALVGAGIGHHEHPVAGHGVPGKRQVAGYSLGGHSGG